jgi:Xaa-Pro aminopeptidase
MTTAASIFTRETLDMRRQKVAKLFAQEERVVLFAAGHPIGKPGGLDACYPFIPHPEYYWLTGARRPGGVLALVPGDGFRHFTKFPTDRERLFDGSEGIPEGDDVEQLADWLATLDTPPVWLGAVPEISSALADQTDQARQRLNVVRRVKDAEELEIMREAVAATIAGYNKLVEILRPGITERQLQIELEAEFARGGADGVGYDTIVGTGARAAVLHGVPSQARVAAGDLVLVDAGAIVRGYTTDVTRTYAASGQFDGRQQAFYDAVSSAIDNCLAACRPGVEWHDIHRLAARTMAEGLREMGILRIDADAALETEAISLFFPHGIGHFVGLGVRDVGGHAIGREPDRQCLGVNVRVDLPLEPGHLMTVEPGLYFVDGIIDSTENREKHRDHVDWNRLEQWRGVGGVRLEDDVLVTTTEPDVITRDIPR